jgi:virulence-associated protein VagC
MRMPAYAMAYAGVFRRAFMPGVVRTARIFRNGRNQAVRIPKEFEFAGRDLMIRREGDALILSARPQDWSGLAEAVATHEFLRWIELPAEGA